MDELTLRNAMLSRGLSVKEGSFAEKLSSLEAALQIAIPARTPSDRTCRRRVLSWLRRKCEDGVFNEFEVLPRVIAYAIEASGPNCRKPAAVFMSLLKKELGYRIGG